MDYVYHSDAYSLPRVVILLSLRRLPTCSIGLSLGLSSRFVIPSAPKAGEEPAVCVRHRCSRSRAASFILLLLSGGSMSLRATSLRVLSLCILLSLASA